jgi:four helix bundle protein
MNQYQKPIKSFRDFIVWQKAHQLALAVYKETGRFPKEEVYGLTSQIRRAAVSTAANIAEGSKRRRSRNDFAHFLSISQGSNAEVQYFIELSRDLRLISPPVAEGLHKISDEIGAMLHRLIDSVMSKDTDR